LTDSIHATPCSRMERIRVYTGGSQENAYSSHFALGIAVWVHRYRLCHLWTQATVPDSVDRWVLLDGFPLFCAERLPFGGHRHRPLRSALFFQGMSRE
jgi:hypothetical protein